MEAAQVDSEIAAADEPNWGWRGWVSAVAFLGAAFLGTAVVIFRMMMVPTNIAAGEDPSLMANMALGVGVAAVVLAVAGAWLSSRIPTRSPPKFNGWSTAVMAAAAAFGVLSVAVYGFVIAKSQAGGDPELARTFRLVQVLVGYYTGIVTLLAASRLLRARLAVPLTMAVVLFMTFMCVPFGTILGLIWFVVGRSCESALPVSSAKPRS